MTLPATFVKQLSPTVDELLDPSRRDEWRDTLYQSRVLVLKGLKGLTKDQLWDIHAVFGTPWTDEEYKYSFEVPSFDTPGKFVTTYSNVNTKVRIGDKPLPWHHDIPWQRPIRYPIRSLYPTRLEGVNTTTNFCNGDIIWTRLPKEEWDELARADVRLQYWYDASKKVENPATRVVPLIEQHPHTKRWSVLLNSFGPQSKALPFSTSYTGAWIVDCWSKSKRLGLQYLNRLHELACTPDNIYEHEWELGDLVLFDNWSGVMHGRERLTGSGSVREFWRMNVKHYWQTNDQSQP